MLGYAPIAGALISTTPIRIFPKKRRPVGAVSFPSHFAAVGQLSIDDLAITVDSEVKIS
jgi:hypothetical protein